MVSMCQEGPHAVIYHMTASSEASGQPLLNKERENFFVHPSKHIHPFTSTFALGNLIPNAHTISIYPLNNKTPSYSHTSFSRKHITMGCASSKGIDNGSTAYRPPQYQQYQRPQQQYQDPYALSPSMIPPSTLPPGW